MTREQPLQIKSGRGIKPTKRLALMSVCMTHEAGTQAYMMQGKYLGRLTIVGIWAQTNLNIERGTHGKHTRLLNAKRQQENNITPRKRWGRGGAN